MSRFIWPLPPWPEVDVSISASAADLVAALAGAAAAGVAAWAVLNSNRNAERARAHQRLDERHRAAVELLAAYEEIQSLREYRNIEHQSVEEYAAAGERDDNNETLKLAQARCTALLRASPEPLLITRAAFFNHIGVPYGDHDEVRAMLESAPTLGNPESEDSDVMRCRAEIVGAIDALRTELSR